MSPKPYDAERISTHGGSIRVFACQKNTHKISPNVFSLLEEENEMKLTLLYVTYVY